MMERFRRFMYGRYGTDALNTGLFVLYIVIVILEMFLRNTRVGLILMILSYGLIVYYFFRCFSKNISKRYAENQKFLKLWNPIKNYFKYLKLCFTERKGTKKLFRCPKCHQTIRVPKGRGKIEITCPKCRFEFIKKT